MRMSFVGFPVIMLTLVGLFSSPITQNPHQDHYYSDCYCRFGYPAPYSCEPEIYCADEGGRCAGQCSTAAQSK
jgi:hypothetical protein